MRSIVRTNLTGVSHVRRLAILLAGFAVAALIMVPAANAQEGVEPTPTPRPSIPGDATVRIEVDEAVQPVSKGDEFEVRVVVDDAERLGSVSFKLEYDPERVEPVRADDQDASTAEPGDGQPADQLDPISGDTQIEGELGELLATGDRGVLCAGPVIRVTDPGKVLALCASPSPPVCLGGAVGVSGSGVIGRMTFKSKGGDMTTLSLSSSELISDNAAPPCDPDVLSPQLISHTRGEAVTVLLSGGGGTSTLLLGAIIAVIVIVGLIGAGAGYVWYKGRTSEAA